MTKFSPVIVSLAILFGGASALAPSKVPQATKPARRATFHPWGNVLMTDDIVIVHRVMIISD